jgi:hypothetical protein
MRKLGILAAALFMVAGCSYLTPVTISTNHLDPEHEIVLGMVKGISVNTYFLGGINGEEEGIRIAVERAKFQVGADNLINVYVDRRITYYPAIILPLYTRVETIVYGTGVRYKDPSWTKIKDYTVPEQPGSPSTPKPPALKPEGVF